MMRKPILFLFFSLLAFSCNKKVALLAVDVYFANAATGSNNGSNCANARALSSHVIGDDVAGNTLHICGTITGTGGSNIFTTLAAGSSGSPITLLWEAGAIVQAPYFPGGSTVNSGVGAIVLNKNYWTLDGGASGIIQNTANGTGKTNAQPSNAIYGSGLSNLTIKNLTIQNLYINQGIVNPTSTSGTGSTATLTCSFAGCGFATGQVARIDSCSVSGYNVNSATVTVSGNAIQYSSTGTGAATGCRISDEQVNEGSALAFGINLVNVSTVRITSNVLHDMLDGIYLVSTQSGGLSNIEIDHNQIYNTNIMVDGGTGCNGCTGTGIYVHDNSLHDMVNWDEGANQNHHNFIHLFASGAGAVLDTMFFYNNVMYGDPGIEQTTSVNFEPTAGGTINTPLGVFNNVRRNDSGSSSHTNSAYGDVNGNVAGMIIANNTFLGNSTSQSLINAGIQIAQNNIVEKNNIIDNYGWGRSVSSTVTTFSVSNHITNRLGGYATQMNGGFFSYTLTTWQTLTGGEAAPPSVNGSAVNVQTSAPWKPNTGSPAIGAGANLYSTCNGQPVPGLGALCSDINGVVRPSAAAWDAGAAQFSGGSGPSPPGGSQITFTTEPLPTATQPTLTAVSPAKTYVTSKGCSQDGVKFLNPCNFAITCSNCSAATALTLNGQTVQQTYATNTMTASVPLSMLLPVPSKVTLQNFAATNSTNVPILSRRAGR